MTLQVNTSATTKELVNDALAFTKYSNDVEAMEYLNDVLTELSFRMKSSEFNVFRSRINAMLNA